MEPQNITFASGHVNEVFHDVRTCPHCAQLFTPVEREALGNPQQWGKPIRARRYTKGRKPGVVSSVRFDADEFEAVSAAAEARGTYTSHFIREAVLKAIVGSASA